MFLSFEFYVSMTFLEILSLAVYGQITLLPWWARSCVWSNHFIALVGTQLCIVKSLYVSYREEKWVLPFYAKI